MDIGVRRLRLPLRRRSPGAEVAELLSRTQPVEVGQASRALEGSDRWYERERELDRECAEVSASILLVASGGITGTVVCGLHQPRVVQQALHALAADLRIDLVLLPRADGADDLAVRPH